MSTREGKKNDIGSKAHARDMVKYLKKTLKNGKEFTSQGWKDLTQSDIEYMNKEIARYQAIIDD